jgi:hypothetical protein
MALYFFHVRGGRLETEDEEGAELPDEAAARQQALVGARSIIAAEILEGRLTLGERIDVADAAGKLLFSLTFAQAVGQSG